MSLFVFFGLFVVCANGAIVDDLSCTVQSGNGLAYSPAATACSNTISDQACQFLYKESSQGVGFPAPGNQVQRPYKCYSTSDNGGSVNEDLRTAAKNQCAKTCGFCCQTSEYNCKNAQFPSINCDTITADQCTNPIWRPIIAKDCPSACGFCNEGGCVDGVTDCANDISICNNKDLQTFVNQYCQKTCNRCSNPSNPSNPPPCTTYNSDSSTACAAWAKNGFCTNDFYTPEQRKLYCATTCKIC